MHWHPSSRKRTTALSQASLDARIHCSSEDDRGACTLFFLKGVGRARWIPTSAGAFSK
ncbi:hypothetical protein PO909_004926 [Leuciscus waleckii]